MTIPIFRDIENAQKTILRRVPMDEISIPESLMESIELLFDAPLTPAEAVDQIIRDVRGRGDDAVREWTTRLDGVQRETIEVPRKQIERAVAALEPALLDALRLAAKRIETFHQRQTRNSWVDFSSEGAMGQLIVPLQRVGIYVPGGSAPLPSTLLMSAIPARVAGVSEIIVCTPPRRPAGDISDVILAAAHIAGVDRVFAVGGAQAIAAMAYGTASIASVDKIVGPGNLFVTLAKRAVFGTVGIESLAGPTETMVIADATADPRLCAADLLAQAEHVLASAILVTPSIELALAVQIEVAKQLETLENGEAAAESVEHRGGIVIVPNLNAAFTVANNYAPEHLCLLVEDPWAYVGNVKNAGGVFLGEQSFEVLGDYIAGPSHIMPTGGTARYASPVNVDDFRKIISLVGLNHDTVTKIGAAAIKIAEAEGLTAHAAAVKMRLEKMT